MLGTELVNVGHSSLVYVIYTNTSGRLKTVKLFQIINFEGF